MELMTEETAGTRPKVEEEEDGRKKPNLETYIGKKGVSAIDNVPKKKYRLDDVYRLKKQPSPLISRSTPLLHFSFGETAKESEKEREANENLSATHLDILFLSSVEECGVFVKSRVFGLLKSKRLTRLCLETEFSER